MPRVRGSYRFLNTIAIDVEILAYIDQYGCGPYIDYGRAGRYEGVRRHDHLITGSDTRRA